MTVSLRIRKGLRHVDDVTWVVSCFDDPVDIMLYDQKTMNRLMQKYYRKSKAKNKRITITDVLTKKVVGKSNFTVDDKKRPDSSSNKQGQAVAT
jgi:hypothetical protein